MYVIQLLDWYAASISVILICLVEVFVVSWTYGASNFVRDVEFMTGNRPGAWWYLCWKYITPVILVVDPRIQEDQHSMFLNVSLFFS